jgi:signal transduction histidine kinase
MSNLAGWLSQRLIYLVSGLYFGAVFLRAVLIYNGNQALVTALFLLLAVSVLYYSQASISLRWVGYFPVYLVIQSLLIFILLALPGYSDFFGGLFTPLSMQVVQYLRPKVVAAWSGVCALVMVLLLAKVYGNTQAVALSLIYTAGIVFFGAYTLARQRAMTARRENQRLAGELQVANQQLQAYSTQLEQLTVARERNRLARELHDSVTQTVFSMTLTTQSALLVLERDLPSIQAYLDRLYQLARSALAEMQLLISQLSPDRIAWDGLEITLRRHLASSHIPDGMSVSLDIEGDGRLQTAEEQCLFRIAEEALNNIVKHAQTSQAHICLHLDEPFYMEIEDCGLGFDLALARSGGGFGLSSMHERATEIGWSLQVITAPGAGACIRVEKTPVREVQT